VEERLRNAVVNAYKNEGKWNFIERDLLLLRRNLMASLSQWASLSEESKKKCPDGLKIILDRKCKTEGKYLLIQVW